jgi:hypothetical protein
MKNALWSNSLERNGSGQFQQLLTAHLGFTPVERDKPGELDGREAQQNFASAPWAGPTLVL